MHTETNHRNIAESTDRSAAHGSLAETMAAVARTLQDQDDVNSTWQAITKMAVESLDGVEHAGITVVRSGKPRTAAASDDLPRAVDVLQYDAGEGPCLDAIAREDTFRTGDLGTETERWPTFGPRAAGQLGVHSMVSFQLFAEADTLGALNFYSHARDAFDDSVVSDGSVFAAHAALALANAREHERAQHLEHALDSNRLIGAACGILMSQHHLTETEAFAVLRQVSQNSNRKVRDVADEVILTGTLPAQPRRDHR